jgi:hypothetical protein
MLDDAVILLPMGTSIQADATAEKGDPMQAPRRNAEFYQESPGRLSPEDRAMK